MSRLGLCFVIAIALSACGKATAPHSVSLPHRSSALATPTASASASSSTTEPAISSASALPTATATDRATAAATASSAPVGPPTAWTPLIARPLAIPALEPDGLCPASPQRTLEVSVLDDQMSSTAWGLDPFFFKPGVLGGGFADIVGRDRMVLMVSNAYHGSILLRGERIDVRGPSVFGGLTTLTGATDGWYNPGGPPKVEPVDMGFPRTGSASIGGNLVPTWNRLQLPAGDGIQPRTQPPQMKGYGWRLFSFLQSPAQPGCYGYQLDTETGTRVVVVQIPA